jgi:hypothetical protein
MRGPGLARSCILLASRFSSDGSTGLRRAKGLRSCRRVKPGNDVVSYRNGIDRPVDLIIFLVVLSMRGASRGVLEAGQSGDGEQSVSRARRTGFALVRGCGVPRRCLASITREVLGRCPAPLREPATGWLTRHRLAPEPESTAPRPKTAAQWQTAGTRLRGAPQGDTRSAAKPVASSTPRALPARSRPSSGGTLRKARAHRSREIAKPCTN